MPRIDPNQLLSCLGVLLTPIGGILSHAEVKRLVSLMTKFSKKLVSKCIYILILKTTEPTLLAGFMMEGGWNLVHAWLQDAYTNENWALVAELLDLLLIAPTSINQLKMNNLPKLVKNLSKIEDHLKIRQLANQLVQNWLKIVKEDQLARLQDVEGVEKPVVVSVLPCNLKVQDQIVPIQQNTETTSFKEEKKEVMKTVDTKVNQCYKLALRDGKHILCKVPSNETNVTGVEKSTVEDVAQKLDNNNEEMNGPTEILDDKGELEEKIIIEISDKMEVEEEVKEKSGVKQVQEDDDKKKEKAGSDKMKQKDGSTSSSNLKAGHSDNNGSSSSKDKHKSGSSSSGSNSSGSSRDKSRSRDKSKERSSRSRSKDKDRHSRDKHRNNGDIKSSSKKSDGKDRKETKEKQAEKDKDTLAKVQPPSLQKLGRIPKKNGEEKKEDNKKPTFSIEVRKSEDKPKTVKVFNAKMRSTGLLEEAKPPPPRPIKKPAPALPVLPSPAPIKRTSPPPKDIVTPPEKKIKMDVIERPGLIKLIPPKPKPPVLQESDIFMDALAASASIKKDTKKRKRRPSASKEVHTSPPVSPSTSAAPVSTGSSMVLRNITPPKFYQDTLETENVDEEEQIKEEKEKHEDIEEHSDGQRTPTEEEETKMDVDKTTLNAAGLRSVLVHTKRKGPRKTIKWKPDSELVEVQFFELDETERVNVTRNFVDMAKMEMTSEREALLSISRKLPNDDVMDAKTMWRPLIEIDIVASPVVHGEKSLEKSIQYAREKSVLGLPLYMHGRFSDSPTEPDMENHPITAPVTIPLEDPDNPQQDLPVQQWPEPKGSPPPPPVPTIPPMFPTMQLSFQNFSLSQPPPFQNMPFAGTGFVPPNMVPNNSGGNEWNNPNNIGMNPMGNMSNVHNFQPPSMQNMQTVPNMVDVMNQGPPPNNMYQPNHDNFNPNMSSENYPQFNQQNMGNMYPMNNFNMRGRGNFRRGGGNGPWVRMNGPGHGGWNPRGRGRFCKNVKNFGHCRNRDNCPFIHPN